MNNSQIKNYLNGGSVVVDVKELQEAPGFLRTTTIHQNSIYEDYKVTIEYDWVKHYVEQDYEGGILAYVAEYKLLGVLLKDLEGFLEAEMSCWVNYTAKPFVPEKNLELDYDKSLIYLENSFKENSIRLPQVGNYEVKSEHFRHLYLYGEFRADKIYEAQEEICFVNQ